MPSCQTLQALSISWMPLAQCARKWLVKWSFWSQKLRGSVKKRRSFDPSTCAGDGSAPGSPWRKHTEKCSVCFWRVGGKRKEKEEVFFYYYYYFLTLVLFFVYKKAGVQTQAASLHHHHHHHHHHHPEIKYSRTAAPCDSFGLFSLSDKIKSHFCFLFLNMTSEW